MSGHSHSHSHSKNKPPASPEVQIAFLRKMEAINEKHGGCGFRPVRTAQSSLDETRVVMMTTARLAIIEDVEETMLGDQFKNSAASSDTVSLEPLSCLITILDSWESQYSKMYQVAPGVAWKFNLLFAVTHTLKHYNTWALHKQMSYYFQIMIPELAKYWRELLAKPDEELKIDSEYTRPGVLAVLEDLKAIIENADPGSHDKLRFDYT